MLLIGLDDTDTLESRGTGHLARQIATTLDGNCRVLGVTRHQLLVDPRVPCTRNNSCAALLVTAEDEAQLDPEAVFREVRSIMLAEYLPGSDPGLCVARKVPGAIVDFGRRAKEQLVTPAEARNLAGSYGIRLQGLGGDEMGVIGALAAVGLAATGEDGRYVLVGCCRELTGPQSVQTLLAAGVAAVETPDGLPVTDGLVLTDKLRPARRSGRPVAVVERAGDYWQPLKLD